MMLPHQPLWPARAEVRQVVHAVRVNDDGVRRLLHNESLRGGGQRIVALKGNRIELYEVMVASSAVDTVALVVRGVSAERTYRLEGANVVTPSLQREGGYHAEARRTAAEVSAGDTVLLLVNGSPQHQWQLI